MIHRRLRAAVSTLMALAWVALIFIPPVEAALGESPDEAQVLPIEDFTGVGIAIPGETFWFRVDYPGGGKPLGITLHLRREDLDVRESVRVFVNVNRRGSTLGEPDKDWPGLTRLGFLTRSGDTGENRTFWTNSSGNRETYFLRLSNDSAKAVSFAMTVGLSEHPAEYIVPPPPSALTQRVTGSAPESAPEPTPEMSPEAVPQPEPQLAPEPSPQPMLSASAELIDGNGAPVGSATFDEDATGRVRVRISITGLTPGTHGMHIHAVGRCEPPAFSSAGGHFNPDGRRHGLDNPQGPHAGDLPNLVAAADETATGDFFTSQVTLSPGSRSVFDSDGSALVVHSMGDDQTTDPTGNSGNPVACGVLLPFR